MYFHIYMGATAKDWDLISITGSRTSMHIKSITCTHMHHQTCITHGHCMVTVTFRGTILESMQSGLHWFVGWGFFHRIVRFFRSILYRTVRNFPDSFQNEFFRYGWILWRNSFSRTHSQVRSLLIRGVRSVSDRSLSACPKLASHIDQEKIKMAGTLGSPRGH